MKSRLRDGVRLDEEIGKARPRAFSGGLSLSILATRLVLPILKAVVFLLVVLLVTFDPLLGLSTAKLPALKELRKSRKYLYFLSFSSFDTLMIQPPVNLVKVMYWIDF